MSRETKRLREERRARYMVALDVAKQEYLLQIELIKTLDEKIEKFLVIATALITALTALLGSNFINSLSVHQESNQYIQFLNNFVVILILCSIYLSFSSVRSFIKGLELRETARIPDIITLLSVAESSDLTWFYKVIDAYERARIVLQKAADDKIKYLSEGQVSLKRQGLILFFILLYVFIRIIFIK